MNSELLKLQNQAHEQAGENFNLDDSKALGEILFDKLGLSGAKKDAQGQYLTDNATLEQINHPLAKTVLQYRELQ